MRFRLPAGIQQLINHFTHLHIGPYIVPCPYYQNITGRNGKTVYLGKGSPEEIEQETIKLFNKLGKNLQYFDPPTIRLYMVMAGLGIDCSGFVTRVTESLLNEKGIDSLIKNIRPNENSFLNLLRYKIRPFTNISAATLTSLKNCKSINLIDVRPGDYLRVGKAHIALITEVEKVNHKIKNITYYHSTSDYLDKHGVRKGTIFIINPNAPLEKQKWNENYRGKNWMLEDYLNAKDNNKGIRRLKILSGAV